MKATFKKIYRSLPPSIQKPVRNLFGQYVPSNPEPLMYRIPLFQELVDRASDDYFKDGRILEIGPRDGLDTKRLETLNPKELVMIDLPEKRAGNEVWLKELQTPYQYIEENLMYMPAEMVAGLGRFRLIWCTGVLYHNAEQMRLLRKLYKLLDIGGYLVLESATLRLQGNIRNGAFVEIHYPDTYRETGTVTHLPTAGAIKAWLNMVGFKEVYDSDCFRPHNPELIGQRYACIAKKNAEDESDGYYQKSGLNPQYTFGDST